MGKELQPGVVGSLASADSMASYIWAEPCHGVQGDHARLAWYTAGCTGGRGPAGHPIQGLVAPWLSPEPQPGVQSADKPSPSPASMEAEARAAKPGPRRSEPLPPAPQDCPLPFPSCLSSPHQAALSCGQTRHLRPSSQKSQHPEQSSDVNSQGWLEL